jgi:hypothetical protein
MLARPVHSLHRYTTGGPRLEQPVPITSLYSTASKISAIIMEQWWRKKRICRRYSVLMPVLHHGSMGAVQFLTSSYFSSS